MSDLVERVATFVEDALLVFLGISGEQQERLGRMKVQMARQAVTQIFDDLRDGLDADFPPAGDSSVDSLLTHRAVVELWLLQKRKELGP